jgi:hypothetical protein
MKSQVAKKGAMLAIMCLLGAISESQAIQLVHKEQAHSEHQIMSNGIFGRMIE